MKKIIVALIIFVIAILGIAIYKNYDELVAYITNKDWQITESVGSVNVNNFYTVDGTSSSLVVVGNNYIEGYANTSKQSFDEAVSLKSAITDSNGDYCIVAENDGTKVYMINGSKKIWNLEIQGTILGVSVNKNGYSAIIYKQAGYKSLVRLIDAEGNEIFTSYLASTYAVDVAISNDNKILAIAEINAEGIKVQSAVKMIDINNIKQENVKKLDLGDNVLIIDIEFNEKNQLVVQTDNAVKTVENGNLKDLLSDKNINANIVSIKNDSCAIIVSKVDNGLFDSSYVLNIYDYKNDIVDKKEYEIKSLPSMVATQKKNIVVLVENELLVINTNGKLVKRFESVGNVKSLVMFDNGNSVALVYRDKIEFLKI